MSTSSAAGFPSDAPAVSAENGQQSFLPLRGLGNVLAVSMAAILAGLGAKEVITVLVALGDASRTAKAAGHVLDLTLTIAIVGWSIAFMVWFWRARTNAESHGYRQRRSRGWAFWGWVLPIVDFWIPFQMMGDIWRAGLPPERQHKTAWLPALWWTAWLLSEVYVGRAATQNSTGPLPHLNASTPAINIAFGMVAGGLLIAIIRAVSNGPVGAPPSAIELISAQPWPGDTAPQTN